MLAWAVAIASPAYSVLAFTLFQLLVTLGLVGFWSLPVELNARCAGSIASIMNFGGNFGGILSPMLAGLLVQQTGAWAVPFYSAAAGLLISALVLVLFVPVRALPSASWLGPGVTQTTKATN